MVNTNTTAPRHPPVVDLADFATRKEEITADLMKAATTIGARPEGGGGPMLRRIGDAIASVERAPGWVVAGGAY